MKRTNVVNEIVSTEESYAKVLQTIEDVYVTPLTESNILSKDEITILFCNLETLLKGAKSFAEQLKERLKEFEVNDNIADVFLLNKEIFKQFSQYIQNYDKASLLFDGLQKKKKFEEFCEQQMNDPRCNNANLPTFLISPVQRIPRYILLMREYIKATDKDHPDALIAEQVMRYLDSFTKEVNNIIDRDSCKQQLRNIAKKLVDIDPVVKDDLLNMPRKLLKEGGLVKQCRKALKERYMYLFNDGVVIYGENFGKKVVYHAVLEVDTIKDFDDTETLKNGFILKSRDVSVTFYAPTFDEKKSWVTLLNFALYQEKVYQFVDDESDDEFPQDSNTDCSNCHSKFSLLNRKHHCALCNKIFCDNCAKKKVISRNGKNYTQRMCSTCSGEKTQESPQLEKKEVIQSIVLPTTPPPQLRHGINAQKYFQFQFPTRDPPPFP
ncbi:FYVE, RhoGEF and PH domain containing protein, putative [Entamoeba invadens IP1]|uniref:FYVE, RhoGEF and PH domain containing protein, putative n=1 Tax=Entamoeba invadens IP1 TaxID=370355 RepID=A0A0A1TXL2_ENTIV|nr:FYVE, RhoGEF and PH domain containing protein, putative [Entamoeba invadens IP1]ELP86094.1 FYVE, RhoGEF and PH domain containing protein, putative [Entamoeba invadens IP1]|eukprot:XP_004185440.1 FYVE, RhoGEF and PH domain containing protein, putative [Entamoeba invadens IP1]